MENNHTEISESYIQHDPLNKCFTTIPNDLLNDKNLKQPEMATLIYLLSKPPKWQVRATELCSRFKLNIKTIQKQLNKLEKIGYIRRAQERACEGNWGRLITYVRNSPIYLEKEQTTDIHFMDNHSMDNHKTVPIVKKEGIKKELIKKRGEGERARARGAAHSKPKKSYSCNLDMGDGPKAYVNETEINEDFLAALLPPRENNPLSEPSPAPVESAAYGEDRLAKDIYNLFASKIPLSEIRALIQEFGPAYTQLGAEQLSNRDTSGIQGLGSYFKKSLKLRWWDGKTSPRTQNRPSSGTNTLNGTSTREAGCQNTSSGENSKESDIDITKRESYWTREENKKLYLALSPEHRKLMLSDVEDKWPYLEKLMACDTRKVEIYSDDFVNHSLFKSVSGVMNDIRFDLWSRRLRSNIPNP